MGVLAQHRDETDWFTTTFGHRFQQALEMGRIAVGQIPGWKTIRTYCETCNESCYAIRHRGERIVIQTNGNRWIIHQCPHPQDQRDYPDDPDQRDGDGELVADRSENVE